MQALLIITIIVLILVITAVGTALILSFIGLIMTSVPFLASPRRAAEKLPEICPLKEGAVFYDIGSGDGYMVYQMAKRFPHARCVGIEIAPLPRILTWIRTKLDPLPNVSFISKDARDVSLRDATHVYTYLLSNMMEHLHPKLVSELRPGTELISCDFKFKEKMPVESIPAADHTLYRYIF